METRQLSKPLALASALMSLFFAPTPASTQAPLGTSILCATGTCCPQPGSTCNAGGPTHDNYFYQTSGSCGS